MVTEVPYVPLHRDRSDVRYAHGPDSVRHEGTPMGTVATYDWDDSAVYPATSRRFHVHVPALHDPTEPASLLVFQDGHDFLDPDDEMRAGVVLDNLVHRGDLPATVAVFVDPGVRTDADQTGGRNRQRNAEYDAFDDRYVTFLADEVLPVVARRWAITDDPARRGICGFSSGGNAAFTAAWHRPDLFGRVVCSSASFAQMPGGNPYPTLIPTTPRTDLRVFLQVGQRDLGHDEPEHNWLAENLRVAAALAEAAYDVRLVVGDGGHDGNQGGVVLPDALRWLFRTA